MKMYIHFRLCKGKRLRGHYTPRYPLVSNALFNDCANDSVFRKMRTDLCAPVMDDLLWIYDRALRLEITSIYQYLDLTQQNTGVLLAGC
jgi:hypothetical protein